MCIAAGTRRRVIRKVRRFYRSLLNRYSSRRNYAARSLTREKHRCSADCTALFSALNAGYFDNNKIPREKRIAFNYFEFPDLLHSPQNYFFSSMKIDPFFVIKSYWKLRFLKIAKHVSLPKFIQIITSNNSSIFSISIENYENHKLIEFIIYY